MKEHVKNWPDCYGCNGHYNPFYDENAIICPLPPKFKDGDDTYECPCVLCLVKVMCNTSCHPVRAYGTRIYNANHDRQIKHSIQRKESK
jgi:hypothetical protein